MTVVIGYLHGPMVYARFAESLLKLVVANSDLLEGIIPIGSSVNVSGPRNMMVNNFLTQFPNAEWLLMLDVDHDFEPTLLRELLKVADAKHKPIVSGVYVNKRNDGEVKIIAVSMEDGQMMTALPMKPSVEVLSSGAGCLLVHRSVFVKIAEGNYSEVYPWFQETSTSYGQAVAEDITFCVRARCEGFKIYLATKARLGHEKSIVYTVGDLK